MAQDKRVNPDPGQVVITAQVSDHSGDHGWPGAANAALQVTAI